MIRSLRFRQSRNRTLPLLAALSLWTAASAPGVSAQEAQLPATPPAQSEVHTGAAFAPPALSVAPIEASRRDLLLGLGQWDHTLAGAFELGKRLLRLPAPIASPGAAAPVSRPIDVVGRFSTSGTHITLDALAKAWKVDQLERNGMNLNMKSPYGTFRLSYREIMAGHANALGGGIGQASAAAIYSTPRFGAGGLLDFSAAALMGNGSINQLLGGGFGNSSIGGFGPHLHKPEGPTVAFKLTF